tara:strand:+ start:6266 stop:7306 length:1041 start_codon:yes stop_codon:yes gene_type:complete
MQFYQGNHRVGTPEVNYGGGRGGGGGGSVDHQTIQRSGESCDSDYEISYLHCLAILESASQYLKNVKNEELNEKWHNVPEWIYECFTPVQIRTLIETCMAFGVLKITAADTLEPIVDWARSIDWQLEGLETLSIPFNSVLVAACSRLNYNNWECNLQSMSMLTKRMKVNNSSVTGMIINGAYTTVDHFGNNCGFYRLINEFGPTTVRLTHWISGEFDEIMKYHITDEGFNQTKYKGISFIPFRKKLTTNAVNPILGAVNGDYQVTMVAGDGIVQVNKQNPLRYEMKSIALITYRSMERDNSDNEYLKLYDEDASGNITTRMIVEIIYNKIHFAALVITEKDVDLGN